MSNNNTELLEKLMAQMEQLNANQAMMADKIEALTAENQQLDQIQSEMAQKVVSLTSENQELKKILTKNPNQAPAKPKIPADIFDVDGRKYRFRLATFKVPARKGEKEIAAQSCTAVDALADPKLLALLVELESGVIAEVIE